MVIDFAWILPGLGQKAIKLVGRVELSWVRGTWRTPAETKADDHPLWWGQGDGGTAIFCKIDCQHKAIALEGIADCNQPDKLSKSSVRSIFYFFKANHFKPFTASEQDSFLMFNSVLITI